MKLIIRYETLCKAYPTVEPIDPQYTHDFDVRIIPTEGDECVTIPEGIEVIAEGAFEKMSQLTEISLPRSLRKIGGFAFFGCENLKEICISKNVTDIGGVAFRGCKNVTVDPENPCFYMEDGMLLQRLEEKARLMWVPEDRQIVRIPEPVYDIDYYVFRGNDTIRSVHFPETMTALGHRMFWDCTTLQRIFLPKAMSYVAGGVFQHCTALKAIVMENPLTFFEHDPSFPDSPEFCSDAFQEVQSAAVFADRNRWMNQYMSKHEFNYAPLSSADELIQMENSEDEDKEQQITEYLLQFEGIESLHLSTRLFHCLSLAGIVTIGDLIAKTEEEISQIRNIGPNCMAQIHEKLDGRGLHLYVPEEAEPEESAETEETE